ncbi:ComEC/Rec2 family competence protein [Clostridium kluyveri]|uniref:ComEC/Rec2 family competence protein n=1 Tax=Clostridium kluyveri TaxID=1534 RepID=UPI002245BD4A|nr:MBL fold metallo-hydrolase [Clostridium kluyveri]UZQ49375.1 MBL fold metallo-hydrolase [Clostridium kluyveri]
MKKIITVITIFILIIDMNTMASARYEKCEVHFLNVGQGDCILIKVKGKCYLIDTGAKYYIKKVIKYLDLNKVNKIEGIILTHYHCDHYDGIIKTVQCKKVSRVYLPGHENSMKYMISNRLIKMGIHVEYIGEGWKLRAQGINLEAVAPLHKDSNIENNNSIVLQGNVGQLTYLFAGDCEKAEEESMINSGKLKKCDVLKVPHHGIHTSTLDEFLKRISPKVAIITSNKSTPNKVVENRLINRGITVWRTDKQGNIFIKNKILYCDRNYTSIKLK